MAAPIERLPATPEETPTAARPQEVIDAIKRFEGKDTKGALALLQAASAKYPGLAPPRVMLANLYFSDQQRRAGLHELELAAVAYPDDPEPHLIFGDIGVFDHRLSDAEVQYRAGEALLAEFTANPARKAALTAQCDLGLAEVAKLRGRWDAARKPLALLLKSQPDNPTAHRRMAEVDIAGGQPDQALQQLRAAVKADPKLPTPAGLMAELYHRMGNDNAAEAWLIRAVDEAPRDIRARLALGRRRLDDGQLDEAAAQFTAAEKLDSKSPEIKLWIGTTARYRHDLKKARDELEAALEQLPDNFSAADQLALLLTEQNNSKDLTQAFNLAASNLRAMPQNAEAEATLGWIDYKLGKFDDAERLLRAAAGHGKISRDTAYYLARLLYDRGRRSEARKLLREALESRGAFAYADEATRLLAQESSPPEAPRK